MPKVTPWYCDWPRLPRVLKAAYCVSGRWLAVPMPSYTSAAPRLLGSARS